MQPVFGPVVFWVHFAQAFEEVVFTPPAPANHHGQAFELRVAQQLDGRVKSIHVEVRDTTQGGGLGFDGAHKSEA
jgi:hypothetical protein